MNTNMKNSTKNLEQNIYRPVHALVLWTCLLYCLGTYLGIPQVTWEHLAAGCVAVVFCAAWCQMGLRGRMVLLAVVVVAFGATSLVLGGGETLEQVQYYVQGLVGADREGAEWGGPQEVIQGAVLAIVCFGVTFLTEQFMGMRVVFLCVWIGVLAADLLGKREMAHMGVVCVLLYGSMVLAEWTEGRWRKERIAGNRQYMVWILPFLVLYFGLMAGMPVPDEPYDWQFVKNAYVSVRETFLQISRNWIRSDREDFSFGTSGFDGENRLLGSVSDEDKTLMVIQGQAGLKTNVYLMGKIYDTFDGTGWETVNESTMDDRQLDALETLYAVNCYDEEGTSKYLERTGLRIWYEDFRTGYLFAPLKTVRMENLENADYGVVGGNYVFESKQGYGLTYQTTFLQLNVDHPQFYEFLKSGYQDNAHLFMELQQKNKSQTKYSLIDLDNRRDDIRKIYGQSCELSPGVQKWLANVTAEASSDVDKLKAIERALQQMDYTKTPGELPEWVDSESAFLDYFLLESKQGYCVYYASAFVLLARAEGIPARYVEGFCVPAPGTQKILVGSRMAHAWPEVYIDHVGWIPFEPTPGYDKIRYTPWEVSAKIGTKEGVKGLDEGLSQWEEESFKEDDLEEKAQEDVLQGEQGQGTEAFWEILGFTVLFAFVAGSGILVADRFWRRRRLRHSDKESRFEMEIAANLRMLAVLGYERRENETLSELSVRAREIMEKGDWEERPDFKFLKFYEDYLYGEYPVKEEMFDVLAQERAFLLLMLKRWKPVRYLYFQLYYNIF